MNTPKNLQLMIKSASKKHAGLELLNAVAALKPQIVSTLKLGGPGIAATAGHYYSKIPKVLKPKNDTINKIKNISNDASIMGVKAVNKVNQIQNKLVPSKLRGITKKVVAGYSHGSKAIANAGILDQ